MYSTVCILHLWLLLSIYSNRGNGVVDSSVINALLKWELRWTKWLILGLLCIKIINVPSSGRAGFSIDREGSSAFSHDPPVNLSFLSPQSQVLLVTSLFSSSLFLSPLPLWPLRQTWTVPHVLLSHLNSEAGTRSLDNTLGCTSSVSVSCPLVSLFIQHLSLSLFLSSCHPASPLTFSSVFVSVSASWC